MPLLAPNDGDAATPLTVTLSSWCTLIIIVIFTRYSYGNIQPYYLQISYYREIGSAPGLRWGLCPQAPRATLWAPGKHWP